MASLFMVRFLAAFLGLLHFSSSDSCPAMYQRFSSEHSFCKPPDPQCNFLVRGLSSSNRQTILDRHNFYRRSVAYGENEKNGLPEAANMFKLVYDEELEQIAQKHADQCRIIHDCNECRQSKQYHVGQNIYGKNMSARPDPQTDWKEPIEKFSDEMKLLNPKDVNRFSGENLEKVGHLTQLVWGKSQRVGCGYSMYTREEENNQIFHELFVCEYGPGGNVIGSPMYKVGRACSQCPSDAECENGLCNLGNELPDPERPKDAIFYCTFRGEYTCKLRSGKEWQVYNTYSGSYAEVVLNGGESSKLDFGEVFTVPDDDDVCVVVQYRKGPDNAKNEPANTATVVFYVPQAKHTFQTPPLQENGADFSTESISLKYRGYAVEISVTVSASNNAAPQFMDVMDVTVFKGNCQIDG